MKGRKERMVEGENDLICNVKRSERETRQTQRENEGYGGMCQREAERNKVIDKR